MLTGIKTRIALGGIVLGIIVVVWLVIATKNKRIEKYAAGNASLSISNEIINQDNKRLLNENRELNKEIAAWLKERKGISESTQKKRTERKILESKDSEVKTYLDKPIPPALRERVRKW